MRLTSSLAAAIAAFVSCGAAWADALPEPDLAAAIPVGTCWKTGAYFEDGTQTRLCFVSEAVGTYEGRVADHPGVLCRGKAALVLEGGWLVVRERDGNCGADGAWTAETITCLWEEGAVETGGPVRCDLAEGNERSARIVLTRE